MSAMKPVVVDEFAIEHVLASEEKQATNLGLDLNELRAEQARRLLQSDIELELEETMPQPVAVTFVEYREIPVLYDDGTPVLDDEDKHVKRMETKTRKVLLNAHVPVELLTMVAALKRKMNAITNAEENFEKVALIYAEAVLQVWQLTEPEMKLKRLQRGLTFKQIRGLFARFFNGLNS